MRLHIVNSAYASSYVALESSVLRILYRILCCTALTLVIRVAGWTFGFTFLDRLRLQLKGLQ